MQDVSVKKQTQGLINHDGRVKETTSWIDTTEKCYIKLKYIDENLFQKIK